MTKIIFGIACLIFSITIQAQTKSLETSDSTSVPLEGTFFKKGKINLSPGYKLSYSMNKTVVTVARQNGGVTGSFRCTCEGTGKTGQCTVSSVDNAMGCGGAGCCGFLITRSTVKMSAAVSADSTVKWQKLVIPKTNITSNSN